MKLDLSLGACPVCKGTLRVWRYKQVDGTNYRICACRECGFGLVTPRPSLSELQVYYQHQGHGESNPQTAEDVLNKERDYPNSTIDAKRIVTTLKEMIGRPGRLLDVGCGYGFFAREAVEQGFQVVGIEMADTERRITQQVAGIRPASVPFEDFEMAPPFDAIVMSQVLEHAADPILWLRRARQLLNDGGVIAIAVPNFASLFRLTMQEKDPYVIPPTHLNYFSPRNLQSALENTGFSVEKAYTISRLPPNLVARRIQVSSRTAALALGALQKAVLKIMDRTSTGMFVNVFARKVSSTGIASGDIS